jgi:hypothetical protein
LEVELLRLPGCVYVERRDSPVETTDHHPALAEQFLAEGGSVTRRNEHDGSMPCASCSSHARPAERIVP